MYAANNPYETPSMGGYGGYQTMADPYAAAHVGNQQVSSHTNSKDPVMVKARVFVGNLNTFRVSRDDLVSLFQSCGNVLGATLFKGYAFVQFSAATEAELCVQTLHGYTWEGSELDVKLAFNTPQKPKSKTNDHNNHSDVKPENGPSSVNSAAQLAMDIYMKNREYAKTLQRYDF